MTLDHLLRFVFVLYCAMAGCTLVVAPWTPRWDQILAHLPDLGIRWLGTPLLRSALSGFGLVHLVWGLHDLADLLLPPYPADGE